MRPRDIDEVFYLHPKVQEACSIGVPHPVRRESVKVFVFLKEGETATQEELIEYCKTRLATLCSYGVKNVVNYPGTPG